MAFISVGMALMHTEKDGCIHLVFSFLRVAQIKVVMA